MDVPVGQGLSLARRLWEAFHDRPSTAPVFRLADYGQPVRGHVTTHVGKIAEIEVHSVGKQPALVRGIWIELSDHRRVELSHPPLRDPLPRPSRVDTWLPFETLTEALRQRPGAQVAAVVVDMSPYRVQRHRFPASWRGLPDQEPPIGPGSGAGEMWLGVRWGP